MADTLGFSPVPAAFFAARGGMVIGYLVLFGVGKHVFYRSAAARPRPRRRYDKIRALRRRAARFSTTHAVRANRPITPALPAHPSAPRLRRPHMTDSTRIQHVEITEDGRTVADASVSTSAGPDATADIEIHAKSGHLPTGTRSRLVDAVLDGSDVQDSGRLRASIPAGDAESMARLRERTSDMTTRAAGSTTLVEATPRPSPPESR